MPKELQLAPVQCWVTVSNTIALSNRSREDLITLQQSDPTLISFFFFWNRCQVPPREERVHLPAEVVELVCHWGHIRE